MISHTNKTKKLVYLSFLSALVIVLQLFCQFVLQANALPISLVLLPIVVGSVLFGSFSGALLGGVFGAVVFICSITGLDKAGFMLCEVNVFITALLCILKGMLAGMASGAIYRLLSFKIKNIAVKALISAAIAPIVNTGVFILGLIVFFEDTLYLWADGKDIITYIFVFLIGINFIVEFAINIIIAPVLIPALAKKKTLKAYIIK